MHLISRPYRIFLVFNYMFLTFLALLCLFPIINVLAISFSSSSSADAGEVVFWPVEFTLKSYDFVMQGGEFTTAFLYSLLRVGLGVPIGAIITVLVAYPLSKESHVFPQRSLYVWIFVFTMLFNGGVIPTFLIMKEVHLLNTIWSLVLPGAVSVFNILLMLNFFRGLPKELEDACLIDGASHIRTLWSVYLPISLPSIATILLFTLVGHWNSWFDGMIYMNHVDKYPLATYLQSILNLTSIPQTNLTLEQAILLQSVSSRTARAAQIFVAAFPILLVYPFLQKYFVKGLVLGSVKG